MALGVPTVKGILELVFGDQWAKHRISIIVGVFIGGVISLLLIEMTSSLLSIWHSVLNPRQIVELAIGNWYLYLSVTFLSCTIVCCLFSYMAERLIFSMLGTVLDLTSQDMFGATSTLADHNLIILKNIIIATLARMSGLLALSVVAFVLLLLTVPGVFVGIVAYGYVALDTGPILLKQVGELLNLPNTATYLSILDLLGSSLDKLRENAALMAAVVAISIAVLASLLDYAICYEHKRLRGGTMDIGKRAVSLTIASLNLPSKLGSLIYAFGATILSDRRCISTDIAIVSEKKLYDTLQKRLSEGGKRCVTTSTPYDPNRTADLIRQLPQGMRTQIDAALEDSVSRSRPVVKILTKTAPLWFRFMTKEKLQGLMEKQLSMASKRMQKVKSFLVFSVAEDGVSAFALVEIPPPNHRTRIIRLFWCSDYLLKESIVGDVQFR